MIIRRKLFSSEVVIKRPVIKLRGDKINSPEEKEKERIEDYNDLQDLLSDYGEEDSEEDHYNETEEN